MSLEDVYKEAIMDHYARPRGRGTLEHPMIANRGHNPTCGDDIDIQVALDEGRISDVRFAGRGCSISQASASMMTVALKGKTLPEAKALLSRFFGMIKGEGEGSYRDLGELQALQGIAKLPARIKCASLAWHTVARGISQYEAEQAEGKKTDA
ncbi:MAG: Fe-S cluster assembly sulfur transfer protein SufU [Symbiobacteriia bacterium]